MPIAVYTKLEGAGRSPAQEGAQEVQEMQEVQERPCGATCGDCANFDPADSSCCTPECKVKATNSAARCFLFMPRRVEP